MMTLQKVTIVLQILALIMNNCESVKDKDTNESIISIAFLLESNQKGIITEISSILKDLEVKQSMFKIQDYYVFINRNEFNETMDEFCSIVYKGVTIIFDMTYFIWDERYDLIRNIQIPILRIDTSINAFIRIAENYIKARDGYDAALIFESNQHFEDALYYVVEECNIRVILYNGFEEYFLEKLKNLRPMPSYYALFATTKNMNTIYQNIISKKLHSQGDKWHLVFLDFKSNEFQYAHSTPLLTTLTPDPKQICKLITSSDQCDIPDSFTFSKILIEEIIIHIQRISQSKEIPTKTWNCKANNNNQSSISKEGNDKISSELLSSINDNLLMKVENDRITLSLNMTIATYGKKLSEPKEEVAIWNQGKLIPNGQQSIKPAKRFFRIGTTEAIPWSYVRRNPITQETILDGDGNPIWEGYCIDLIAKLAEKMNFDYKIVHPKHGTFGECSKNGTWDGLVGDLARGETQIAVAALKMTAEREEVIDFVAPYFEQTGISIVIRKAVKQTSLFKFMTVLRLEVWLSIVAALTATAFMLWILEIYSPYSARNNKEAYPYPCREFTLKESFWFALTSFTPQGGGETPKAISGRTLVAAYWLFVVLMLATFTANLAAFLTVERMQTPVQSLEQLARQSRINYTVVEGSDTHKYFINMKFAEDTLYRLWKELTLNATADQSQYRIWDYPVKEQYGHILLAINDSEPVKDAAEGFRKVNEHENADFAFIHDSAEIKYEIAKNCNLTEVGEVFAEQPYAIAVQQGSHMHDEISYAILELQKERFLESLTQKFWNNSATKECSKSEDNEGITLESLGGVFIATLFGLGLALITLVGEVIYYRRKNILIRKVKPRRNDNNDQQHILNLDYPRPLYKTNQYHHTPKTPPPTFEQAGFDIKENHDNVTLGKEFIPSVARQRNRVSYLSEISARNSIHENISYIE